MMDAGVIGEVGGTLLTSDEKLFDEVIDYLSEIWIVYLHLFISTI